MAKMANKTSRKTATSPRKTLKTSAAAPANSVSPKVSPTPEPTAPQMTKQDRVLTLLARPTGASIDEIMHMTDWQVHSVRGFLAGTVKKKLGFTVISSRSGDEVRRYRIEARLGR